MSLNDVGHATRRLFQTFQTIKKYGTMKVSLSRTLKDDYFIFMLLPVVMLDWSSTQKAVTFGWLFWFLSIYHTKKGGQP